MKKIKFLHLIPKDKFTLHFLEFIDMYYDISQHAIIVYGNYCEIDSEKLNRFTNVIIVENPADLVKKKEFLKLFRICTLCIVNGVFGIEKLLLFLRKPIYNKLFLVLWGGEIYQFRDKVPFHNFNQRLSRQILRHTINKAAAVITLVSEDYEVLKKYANPKGKHFVAPFPCGQSQFELRERLTKMKSPEERVIILLGNSATKENNHKEAMDLLLKFKDNDMEILCPLSYGDEDYREETIRYGKMLFKDKFIPLIDFLSLEEYFMILSKVTVGVFNNNRQQAMGNISALLQFGAKIYMRADTAMWKELSENKKHILYEIDSIAGKTFEAFTSMDNSEIVYNRNKLKEYQNGQYFKQCWDVVFNTAKE